MPKQFYVLSLYADGDYPGGNFMAESRDILERSMDISYSKIPD